MSFDKLTQLVQTPIFLGLSMIVLISIITISQLVFATERVTKGYLLRDLEEKHNKLLIQNENEQMRVSSVRSMAYLQDMNQIKYMNDANAQMEFVIIHDTIAQK